MIPLGGDNDRYELLLGTLCLYKFALQSLDALDQCFVQL